VKTVQVFVRPPVQKKYNHTKENHGSEQMNLVVAKGYLKKQMENEAVRSYVAWHAIEILVQFELELNAVSMEELWSAPKATAQA
tara:strand:- start:1604 stop:1855 length:252 start_codon:yes stop_codon:yes gene_type:complete